MGETLKYQIAFELLGLPKTPNGSHGHWRTEHAARTRWKHIVHLTTCSMAKPPQPLAKAKLVLTRFSSSRPDFDNLARSFKPILDALVEEGFLTDDSHEVVGIPDYRWEQAKAGAGRVRVEVTECE